MSAARSLRFFVMLALLLPIMLVAVYQPLWLALWLGGSGGTFAGVLSLWTAHAGGVP